MIRFSFFLFLTTICFLSLKGQTANIDDGIYLNLNFNQSLEDISGKGNDANHLGTFFSMDRFGNCEFALGFDEYLQLCEIKSSAFHSLNDFTVSFWAKKSTSGFATLLSVANNARDNEFNINITENGVVASNIRNLPNVPGIRIDGNMNVGDGEWHHIVITRDGTSGLAKIYIDNNLDSSKNMPLGVIQVGNGGFVLGNDQDCLAGCYSTNQQFKGAIDDLRVYNRVLSENEIDVLFKYSDGEINNTFLGSYELIQTCESSVQLDLKRNYDSFKWNTGSSSSSLRVTESGRFIVKGWIKDCEYADTVDVELNSLPELTVVASSTDLTCSESVVLEATQGYDEYVWQDGTTGRIYVVTEPGNYVVNGSNFCGANVSNIVEVSKEERSVLSISATKTSISCGEVVQIMGSGGFEKYTWSNGEEGESIAIRKPGNYEVTVVNECGDRLSQSILIAGEEQADYFIPNTFTPNGDGKNENFEIDQRLLGASISIVNRWGTQVYSSENYQNDWNGANLPSASYYYLIQNECLFTPVKGWIQIVR